MSASVFRHHVTYTTTASKSSSPAPWRVWLAGFANAVDHLIVLLIKLALLGAVVWCGTIIVRHVTVSLQEIAGRPGVAEPIVGAAR